MNHDQGIHRARDLRRQMTDAERLLWATLRNRQFAQYKFRRQVPIGDYIVDFVCFEQRLVIELDGSGHLTRQKYDAERTRWLESQGFRVIRFWNEQLTQEHAGVEKMIWRGLHGIAEPDGREEGSDSRVG